MLNEYGWIQYNHQLNYNNENTSNNGTCGNINAYKTTISNYIHQFDNYHNTILPFSNMRDY